MMSPNLYEQQQARLADLMRAAEQSRRAKIARGEKLTPPLYATLLAKLGGQLVVLGENLQTHYGELLEDAQQVNVENFHPRNTSSSVGY